MSEDDFIEWSNSFSQARAEFKEAMIAGLNKFLRIYYGKVTELYNSIDEQLN